MDRLEGSVVPTSVHKPQKTPKRLQNEKNSKKRLLFVERLFWSNFGVFIGFTEKLYQKRQKPQKRFVFMQNRQKPYACWISSMHRNKGGVKTDN
jgi:hypothetical protein